MPARVVLHTTSIFTAAEIDGFQSAADEGQLDALDMSWITYSEGARLFRPGAAAPLRGTLLTPIGGRMPVTIRTANQVKSILQFCAPNLAIAIRYAHYM